MNRKVMKRAMEQRPREEGVLVSVGHAFGQITVNGLKGYARVDFATHPSLPRRRGLRVALDLAVWRSVVSDRLETVACNIVAIDECDRKQWPRLQEEATPACRRCLLATPPLVR